MQANVGGVAEASEASETTCSYMCMTVSLYSYLYAHTRTHMHRVWVLSGAVDSTDYEPHRACQHHPHGGSHPYHHHQHHHTAGEYHRSTGASRSVCSPSGMHHTNNPTYCPILSSLPPLLQSDVEHLEGTILVLEVAVGTRDGIPDNTTLVSQPSPPITLSLALLVPILKPWSIDGCWLSIQGKLLC